MLPEMYQKKIGWGVHNYIASYLSLENHKFFMLLLLNF